MIILFYKDGQRCVSWAQSNSLTPTRNMTERGANNTLYTIPNTLDDHEHTLYIICTQFIR